MKKEEGKDGESVNDMQMTGRTIKSQEEEIS
jgi:hypothetical protein